MSYDSIQIIYDIGEITDWISAIGTLGAVIVSLYLARREHKPRAKVRASFLYLIDDIKFDDTPFAVAVEIVNVGLMPIYLKECTFKVGKKQKMAFSNGDHKVDKILSSGEVYSHNLNYEPIRKYLLKNNIKKYKTHIYFEDGSGKKYKTKITFRI